MARKYSVPLTGVGFTLKPRSFGDVAFNRDRKIDGELVGFL